MPFAGFDDWDHCIREVSKRHSHEAAQRICGSLKHKFEKHAGPGNHPSGSPQSVHGRKTQSLSPRAIAERVAKGGGFTVHTPSGAIPSTGYMVSQMGNEEVFDLSSFTINKVEEYMKRHKAALDDPETFFGGWLDTETNKVYLDISRKFLDRIEARRFAEMNNQLAFFNLETFETIRTEKESIAKAENKRFVYINLDGLSPDRIVEEVNRAAKRASD